MSKIAIEAHVALTSGWSYSPLSVSRPLLCSTEDTHTLASAKPLTSVSPGRPETLLRPCLFHIRHPSLGGRSLQPKHVIGGRGTIAAGDGPLLPAPYIWNLPGVAAGLGTSPGVVLLPAGRPHRRQAPYGHHRLWEASGRTQGAEQWDSGSGRAVLGRPLCPPRQ